MNIDWSQILQKSIPAVGAGLTSLISDPGTFYTKANWKGNGLANTDLGYIANPNYTNPYDVGQMLGSTDYGNMFKNIFGNKESNIANGNTLEDTMNGNLFGNNYGLNIQGYNIPSSLNFLGPNIAGKKNVLGGGDIGNYNLKTTQSYSIPAWLK